MDKTEKDYILERIMIEYGNELIRLAFSYVRDMEIAKDMVQNTFIKCYKNLDSLRYDALYVKLPKDTLGTNNHN